MPKANKEILKRWNHALNQGKAAAVAAIPTFFKEDYVYHQGSSYEYRGLKGCRDMLQEFFDAFSPITVEAGQMRAEGEMVIEKVTIRGTHSGPMKGITPTGRPIELKLVGFARFADGKLAEYWDTYSEAELLSQIGADTRVAAFEGVKNAMTMYGGFFQDVAKEIGMERALALHAKQGEVFGKWMAAALKDKSAEKGLNTVMIAELLKKTLEPWGLIYSPEIQADRVNAKHEQCPMYEGWRGAGLDHATIQSMCQSNVQGINAALQATYPGLSEKVQFRATPEDACVEEFALAR